MSSFSRNAVVIDSAAETDRIVGALRDTVRGTMRRGGAVVGISGGVDSAVVAALCVRAFGPARVVAVTMPERDSDPQSERLALDLAAGLGLQPVREDITAALQGAGCYRRRDEAARRVFPDYDADLGYTLKISLPPNLLDEASFNVYTLTVVAPDGRSSSAALGPREFLQIVAASNFKQRTRMSMLYYHAELRSYAVVGTANKNEREEGFFVKHGDAGVDINAISHLYKSQVYQLAEYLDVPEAIRVRPPTSDTYSAPCDQQEFYFRLPFATLDLLWEAWSTGIPVEDVARVMEMTPKQVDTAFEDFARRRRTTAYLRMPPREVA